jgi:hypothetical protein
VTAELPPQPGPGWPVLDPAFPGPGPPGPAKKGPEPIESEFRVRVTVRAWSGPILLRSGPGPGQDTHDRKLEIAVEVTVEVILRPHFQASVLSD